MLDSLDIAPVIAQVESATSDAALRFEPALYEHWATPTPVRDAIVANIRSIHKCSRPTARMIACTSWGRYQILGENLYSAMCGCRLSVFGFVASPGAQLSFFREFLRNRGIDFTLQDIIVDPGKRQQFVEGYNGPGDIDAYWVEIKDAVKMLGGPTVVA